MDAAQLERTWAAVADHTRRRLLDSLRRQDASVNELVQRLDLTQPQASKHLKVLREAGLVAVRADAQRRIYALEPAPMRDLDAWLAPYRERWNASLDRLDHHLEEHP
jgi:DNA-binding transcriptional ArsR family regulator